METFFTNLNPLETIMDVLFVKPAGGDGRTQKTDRKPAKPKTASVEDAFKRVRDLQKGRIQQST